MWSENVGELRLRGGRDEVDQNVERGPKSRQCGVTADRCGSSGRDVGGGGVWVGVLTKWARDVWVRVGGRWPFKRSSSMDQVVDGQWGGRNWSAGVRGVSVKRSGRSRMSWLRILVWRQAVREGRGCAWMRSD